jgi:hypothetical protein
MVVVRRSEPQKSLQPASSLVKSVRDHGEAGPTSAVTNMRISLINYFYFFLDLHEPEAYSAIPGMESTVMLREEQQ